MKTKGTTGLAVAASLLLCMHATSSQAGWVKHADGAGTDVPFGMIRSADGSYAIVGQTDSAGTAGGGDAAIWKLNSDGELSWVKSIGGSSTDLFTSVTSTPDGGYCAIGRTESAGAGLSDILMAKFDASGELQWQRTYGTSAEELSGSVVSTSDGGFVFSGRAMGPDLLVVKTDGAGNISWTRSFDYFGSSADTARSVIQTTDGGYLVAGTAALGGTWGILYKLDAAGNLTWSAHAWGMIGGSTTQLLDAIQTTDGGFLCVGSSDDFGSGLGGWALKVSSTGSLEWQRGWDSAAVSQFIHAERASGSDLMLIGNSGTGVGFGAGDAVVVRISASGSPIWQKVYGGSYLDSGMDITSDAAGGYILSASSDSFNGVTPDLLNVSIDGNGSIGSACAWWEQTISASTTATSIPYGFVPYTSTVNSLTNAPSSLAVGVPVTPQSQSCGDASGEANLTGAWTALKKKGLNVRGTFTVRNTGSVDAGAFAVRIYFSRKPKVTSKSLLFRSTTMSGLAAGGSSSAGMKMNATPPKKCKYVIGVIDPDGVVAESNETDNVVARAY